MSNWIYEHRLFLSLLWLGSGFLTGITASIFYVAINWNRHFKFKEGKVKEWLPIALGIPIMLTPFGLTVVGLVPFYLLSLLIAKWVEDDDRGGGGDEYFPGPTPRPSGKLNPKDVVEAVIREVQGRLARR